MKETALFPFVIPLYNEVFIIDGGRHMAKGKDKGKSEEKKKPLLTSKEKRSQKKEKKSKAG
jgi:hypothetical protein